MSSEMLVWIEIFIGWKYMLTQFFQAKKGGGEHSSKEAEQAEQLLLMNKPFTELMSVLAQLVRFSMETGICDTM